jgi:hypothetical protein
MAIVVSSSHLPDADFLAALEACTLPPSCFRHGDHLRLAWLCVHAGPLDLAILHVRETIQRYAAHLGKAEIFHETITAGWVRLLASHSEASFAEFLRANESRLNKDLLHRFWSPERLASARARAEWLPPDLRELPPPVARIPATFPSYR